MKISEFMDLKKLQEIQDSFSNATGLAAIAVDAEGAYITEGSNFTDFCMKYTRGSEEGQRRCVKCDNECKGTYYCHAGLMDFAADIVVEGEKVGAIIGGQVLPKEPGPEEFERIAGELGIDPGQYLNALKKVPIRTEKSIRAAAAMLENVVNMLVNSEYVKNRDKKKIQVYDTEVANALGAIKEIKTKVHGLEGVATKENILSLNASIEAARAGEFGAGFAVVAKEIETLSRQSAEVYGDIRKLSAIIEQAVSRMDQAKG